MRYKLNYIPGHMMYRIRKSDVGVFTENSLQNTLLLVSGFRLIRYVYDVGCVAIDCVVLINSVTSLEFNQFHRHHKTQTKVNIVVKFTFYTRQH